VADQSVALESNDWSARLSRKGFLCTLSTVNLLLLHSLAACQAFSQFVAENCLGNSRTGVRPEETVTGFAAVTTGPLFVPTNHAVKAARGTDVNLPAA
jgi:hypothetical protein